MIDMNTSTSRGMSSYFQNEQNYSKSTENKKEQSLFMSEVNDRMAGSVPVWREVDSAREQAVFRLSQASQSPDGNTDTPYVQSFKGYMVESADKDRAFGFDDLIDFVNPLHHIPIIGPIYRGITGDEINPASRIIGGTIFGGPTGAAIGLANVISEEETGKDIPELVLSTLQEDNEQSARYEAKQRKMAENAYKREPITHFSLGRYNE